MTLNLARTITLVLLFAGACLLSECMGPPPDMAPAAAPAMHETYTDGLIHRTDMIQKGRTLHPHNFKLVV